MRSISICAPTNAWPVMYRPTRPERFASPFGKRELVDRQEQMRRPGVTGRQHEPPRAILDHLSCRAIDRLRGDDSRRLVVDDEPPHERAIVQRRSHASVEQRLEREIGRVSRAGRADLAGVAALTDRAAVVGTVFLACGVPQKGTPLCSAHAFS